MEVSEVIHYDADGKSYSIERRENRLDIAAFDHSLDVKKNCEGCPNYKLNLSCPPQSPYFPDYIANSREAEVICYRVPLDKFEGPVREAYHVAFKIMLILLVGELMGKRKAGYIIAGSGACLVCEPCAGESGVEECHFPDKRIYSLESMGVNVVSLCEKAFGIKLEWSDDTHTARFVSTIGAVFK